MAADVLHLQAWQQLVASGVSTIVSRAVTYPADTLKARLQVQGALSQQRLYESTLHGFRHIWQSEGAGGFYRGFLPVLSGVLPATMVYFYSYETAKAFLSARVGPAGDFAVGGAAQLSAGIVFTPVDVIKERLQVQGMTGGSRSTAMQALQALLRHDGPTGLLRGYWMTNSVWIPWTSIYIALYEASKRRAALYYQNRELLPAWVLASGAAASAAAAAVVTHPLDVVKTRLQVLSGDGRLRNVSASGIFMDMMRREGLAAFGHGCFARVLQIAPGSAISWLLYETCKCWLRAASADDS